MTFTPLVSVPFLVVFTLSAAGLVLWGYRRTKGSSLVSRPGVQAIRRALMAAMVVLALAGPAIPREDVLSSSNVEIVFAIDRTGSMAAEDGPDGAPRLDAVRRDVAAIVEGTASARYAVVTWDSSARVELPFTTDSSAVLAFADALHQEVSEFSSGSATTRPVGEVVELLEHGANQRPQNIRYLVVFTDGEPTSNVGPERDWTEVAPLIDGGAVIGYGTEEGGPMRIFLPGGAGTDEYMVDEDGSEAISRIDLEGLEQLASESGLPLLVNPDEGQVNELATSLMTDADLVDDERRVSTHYRYLTWVPALLLGVLVVWEAASFTGLMMRLRRTDAL